eukprot:13510832-Alexandrium_andersonii.AAC.1
MPSCVCACVSTRTAHVRAHVSYVQACCQRLRVRAHVLESTECASLCARAQELARARMRASISASMNRRL